MGASKHLDFATSYLHRRHAFLSAADMMEADVMHYRHPYELDINGKRLCIDVARIGPENASKILIVSSGTHGIEGLIGSDIQSDFMRFGMAEHMPDDQAVVLVHALNPYGLTHGCRVNEDNVDLNRNFIDWSKGTPESHSLTDRVTDMFQPKVWRWPQFRAAGMILRYGLSAMQSAVSQGQYSRRDGLFYGGHQPVWSNLTWNRIIDDYASKAEKIVHIDLHTGLGKCGASEIILDESPSMAPYKRAKEIWRRVVSTQDGSSSSAALQGTMCAAFNAASGIKAEVTSVLLEFGTQPALKVLRALAMDNWVRGHQGVDSKIVRESQVRMREAFYPSDDLWKRSAIARGRDVLNAALLKM